MKDELMGKFMPPSYYARLLDRWHQFSQGNKSVKKYVAKFDEFLIRCSAMNKKDEAQIISRFRYGLIEDLRTELFACGVTELEKAYVLVQDLDTVRSNHAFRSHDQRTYVSRLSLFTQPHRSSTLPPPHRSDVKGKSVEQDNRSKGPEWDLSKISTTAKCYNC